MATDADRAARRAPAGTRAAHLPPRRGALPVRRSGRHRAVAVRPRRRAVPDDVLPHVPPSRCGRVAARGRRRRRALERGRAGEPALAASLAAATRSSAGCGGSSPGARPAATVVPRSSSASAARAAAGASSASTPTSPSRSPVPATSSASGSSPRSSRSGPTGAARNESGRGGRLRQEWEDGTRRLEAAREDGAATGSCSSCSTSCVDELRKRIGQTYTLDRARRPYGEAESWAREAARGTQPRSPTLAARSQRRARRRIRRISARRSRLRTMRMCALTHIQV